MSASRKLRILVVENDPEWLVLVLRLFSDHVVKPVRDYPDALQIVEDENLLYDVAIVDLNLIDSPDHRINDMLGGEILLKLHRNHPSTLRIALTGAPPRGPLLKNMVEKYQLNELFMKSHMELADLRGHVLESPVAIAVAREPVTPGLEAQKAEQSQKLRAWAEVREAQLNQQLEERQQDFRFMGRVRSESGGAIADEARLKANIERLVSQRDALSAERARIEAMLAKAHNIEDISRVAREIDRLMGSPAPGGTSYS